MMQTIDREPSLYEVILCCENNSWLFSTYAHTARIEAALEQAEDEFLIHTSLHDIGIVKASSAYVLTEFESHYFSKRNGKWQTASSSGVTISAAAQKNIPFPLGNMNHASCPPPQSRIKELLIGDFPELALAGLAIR